MILTMEAIDSVNFGMPYGGKFLEEKNENSGRPFVFSIEAKLQFWKNSLKNIIKCMFKDLKMHLLNNLH